MFGEAFVLPGLGIILLLVLVLPFSFKQVEHNLEAFLFVMGLAAALVSGIIDSHLVIKAIEEPILISGAVLIAGLLFKVLRNYLNKGIYGVLKVVPLRVFMFLVVAVLGLASSLITAIIASLVLVEIVNVLPMDRRNKVNFTIVACFAIGLGAALTPIGEPLATIAVSKLNADFGFLLRLIGPLVIPAVIGFGIFAAVFVKGQSGAARQVAVTREGATGVHAGTAGEALAHEGQDSDETFLAVIIRAAKVYLFVMALVFLGEGFKPVIDRFVIGLPGPVLYWLNMVSAVLDNATLTAAEISDKMSHEQVRDILMGLLISGGMLIPGNIPNIISASKLRIGSKEWARLGVPLGLVVMALFFVILMAL